MKYPRRYWSLSLGSSGRRACCRVPGSRIFMGPSRAESKEAKWNCHSVGSPPTRAGMDGCIASWTVVKDMALGVLDSGLVNYLSGHETPSLCWGRSVECYQLEHRFWDQTGFGAELWGYSQTLGGRMEWSTENRRIAYNLLRGSL